MKKYIVAGLALVATIGAFAAGEAATVVEELSLTEKMTQLALQIGLILFAAKLGSMLASKMNLPTVLGELAAGIVIGPWALGGIGFGHGLFEFGFFRGAELRAVAEATGSAPFAVSPELYGICTIASVVLLFLSGIETNLKTFLRFAFAGSLVGIGGVVFSFAFGDLCAVYLLPKFMPETFGYLADLPLMAAVLSPSAMFMGIMGTATSVGITARILSERRKMDTEEGVTIMAGAVIDDVLGIIVLAIGMGVIMSRGPAGGAETSVNWGHIGMVALNAFGLWLGGTVIGILLARRISWILKMFGSPVAIATLAFGLSLVIAGVFESFGLTLIIGAYVMGLSLSRTDLKHVIQENLQSVYTFLVPVFFCVMGMMVDMSALMSKPVLIFGAIYTVLAILAKVIGCALPSLFCGFTPLGAMRIGAGMIPRGEVALIIAGIGVSTIVDGRPILSQEVFGIGILMTLVTTVISPPFLVSFFNLKGNGVRGKRQEKAGTSNPFSFELASAPLAQFVLDGVVKAFREDGFFTYLLNPEENIWSVQKDDMDFAVSRKGKSVCFDCSRGEEESLAMSAWMEVMGEVNALAQSMANPVRQNDLQEMLKKEAGDWKVGLRGIAAMVGGYVMLPSFAAASTEDAISRMLEEVRKAHPDKMRDLEMAKAVVLEREAALGTGFEHGIALPHGRTDAVTGVIGAVALVDADGIPGCETHDGEPVRIVVLTLAPREPRFPYLQLIAFISRTLRTADGYKRLLACKTAEDMRRFFGAAR